MNDRETPSEIRWQPHAYRFALAGVTLAALIVLLHGRSLDNGRFMDDWAHFRQLQKCGWSLGDLAGACRLELVGGVVDLWWLPECTLRFFRPVAFGLIKIVYTASGWDPFAQHVAALGWHFASCMLLFVLLRGLGATGWVAWASAALFAIHPGHVASVQWIACQTELMVTTFILGATLCWARWRGWPGFAPTTHTPRVGWAAAAVVLYALALGCRENAILFPLVVLTMEPFVRRKTWRPRVFGYAGLFILAGGYLLLRAHYLAGFAMPPKPYVIPPTDPDFIRFIFDKACYYLLGEFLLVPCVPIGGLPYFRSTPWVFYGLSAAVVLLITLTCRYAGRDGAGVLAPAWLVAYFMPLLPAFASPHHLYLPGVAWAVIAMLLLQSLAHLARRGVGRLRVIRQLAWWGATGMLGVVFGLGTYYFGLALDIGQQVEDRVIAEVADTADELEDGDTLYIANLPLLGHYVRLGVEERTGLQNLHVIPLTWAPRLLGAQAPTRLECIDERTIEVSVAEDYYFSGPLERLVVSARGGPLPDVIEAVDRLGLRIEVRARDDDGIRRLRFHFTRPLTDPRVHLYWGSRVRWAQKIYPEWK